jgi:hypothetical protein
MLTVVNKLKPTEVFLSPSDSKYASPSKSANEMAAFSAQIPNPSRPSTPTRKYTSCVINLYEQNSCLITYRRK